MKIVISDRQRRFRLDRRMLSRLATFLARAAKLERKASLAGVTLIVTDDAGMSRMHARCLGEAAPTDVISLAYDPIPGEGAAGGAEIVVNAETAFREGLARRATGGGRWDACSEFALYVAHGMDHLSGFTDSTPGERSRMRRRELAWLGRARRMGLIAPLLKCHDRKD
jgi:rRNA maturation RNase YbeY